MNKYSRVAYFSILMGTAALCFVSGCDNKTSKESADRIVTAAYVPAAYYLPFLIVEHDGLLAKRGYTLSLKTFQDNTIMINSFLNGHLDVTAQSALTMFPVEANHPGLFKFIYSQYNESYSFVVPTDATHQTLSDLKGQKIGTWKSPTAEACIKMSLKRAGLDEGSYEIKRFGATEWAPALENHVVNVVFGFDVPAEQLVSGGKFRYLKKSAMKDLLGDIPLFNGGAFIHTRLIATNPKKAQAIKEAFLEAIDVILKEPDRYATILAKRLSAPQDVAKAAVIDRFNYPDQHALDSAEATFRLMEKEGLMQKAIDTRSMFWLSD